MAPNHLHSAGKIRENCKEESYLRSSSLFDTCLEKDAIFKVSNLLEETHIRYRVQLVASINFTLEVLILLGLFYQKIIAFFPLVKSSNLGYDM